MGKAEKQKRLLGHKMMTLTVRTNMECFLRCKSTVGCVSVNACKDPGAIKYPGASDRVLCELNQAVASDKETDKGCTHYELDVTNCN